MLATLLLRTAIIATPWLAKLGAAESPDPVDAQKPLLATSILSSMTGTTMEYCGDSISVCGKTDKVKVVRSPKSTVYVTRNNEFEVVTELPPEYVTVTQISVKTVNNQTEGHCRNTTTIYDEATTTVTVDRNVTTTREYVPIEYITTVETKTVTAKALHQCFVKEKPSLGSGPAQPADSRPSVPNVQGGGTSADRPNSSEGTDAGGEGYGAGFVSKSTSTDTAAAASTGEDIPSAGTDTDASADADADDDTDAAADDPSAQGFRYY